jgi:hypothetical protein
MSFNPICKPEELAKLTFKDYKPDVAKSIKKMHAKGHSNMENLVPIFLNSEHTFADKEEAMFLIVGKLNGWKKFINAAISKDPTHTLKGYGYAIFSEETGYELKVAPVKGKMRKEAVLDKAFKKLVGTKAIINLLPEMEESDDFENRMENVVEVDDKNPNPNVLTTPEDNNSSKSEILTVSVLAETRAVIAFYKDMRTEKTLGLIFGDEEDFGDAVDRLKLICELAKNFETAAEENKLKIRQDAANALAGHINSYLEVCDMLQNNILNSQANALKQLKSKIFKFASPIIAPKLKITARQIEGKTFGERGVAGEQSASDVAKAKRDALVDEVSLELAKLLNLGKNKDSDELFADVIRWVAVASANLKEAEVKYVSATKKLYQTESSLGADLRASFGNGLRGEFIQQLLLNKVSEYASLATALGALGKTAFSRMFSGEKQDAIAIYSEYSSATIKGLIAGKDNFAKAAFAKLSPKQKEQIASLGDLQKNRAAIDNKKDPIKKQKAQDLANKSSDEYLLNICDKLNEEAGTFVSLSEDKLFAELETWAKTASLAEKTAISNPSSKFYKYLLLKKGQREVDLALHIINKPQLDEKDAEFKNNETFHQLGKISVEQEHKSSVSRWWNNNETGQAVQKLLLADNINNPQEAIVSKFSKGKLAEFNKPIPANASPQEQQKAQNTKDAILKEALSKMKEMLEKAAVPKDFQETIEESIASNGARGLAYQKMAKLATDNPNGIADKVTSILKELDPSSIEWASIKKDTQLLETLKNHIIGWFGQSDWGAIVKLLGLTGQLAEITKKSKNKTATEKNYKTARQNNRLKVTTAAEKEKLAKEQEEQQKAPAYWAQTLAFKYEKGFFTDTLELMSTVMDAQKQSDWAAIQNELKIINLKALAYILEFIAKKNITAQITPSNLFKIIESEDNIFAQNAKNVAKFKKVISKMDSLDLLSHCFNLESVKIKATELLNKKKQATENFKKANSPEEKKTAQAKVDKTNVEVSKATMDMIRSLDISIDFTKSLNKIFSPNLAFDIKTLIRDKVVAQLAGADPEAVKQLLPTFSHEEVKLLVEFIRALSSNEKEDMSRTGVQYRGLTSKGQQRDIAAAVHSRELAQAQNMLNSQVYHTMKPKEKQAFLKELNKNLQITGEEKQAKFKSFEETKKKYDERVKKVVNFVVGVALKFITAPLETIPFLGTAIEAAVKAVVESLTDKILGGDRVGSWKTVLATAGKKLLLNLAKGLLAEAAPMLLSSALGDGGFLALENAGNKINETVSNIINANAKIANAVATIKSTAEKIQNALSPVTDFIKNAQEQLESFKEIIENNLGLVGKVAIEVVEEQVDELKEAMGEKAAAFRDKLLNKIDGQRGYLVKGLTILETVKGYYDKAQEAFEAIQSMAAKSRLEQFQSENPDLAGEELLTALKEMEDFKDWEDADWKKITEYADASDKLQETFDDFIKESTSEIIDPILDDAFGESEEEEEEQEIENLEDNTQLSAKAPKKSLINLRAALQQQGESIPEFLDALIAKL